MSEKAQTTLDQADEMVKGIIRDIRAQFKRGELSKWISRLGLLRGDSSGSKFKLYRILNGEQAIQARELFAILIAMGYVIEIEKNGEQRPVETSFLEPEPDDDPNEGLG